jgi:murein DD-endopeptidase MepM/ murein hydrolase activator NlpD
MIVTPVVATVTGSQTTVAPVSDGRMFRLSGKIFFDYNGNGKEEKNEPPISGVAISLDNVNLTLTNSTGWYVLDRISKGNHSLRIYGSQNFRYISESDTSFRRSNDAYRIQVENDTRKDIGLMEGYLTLPFEKDTTETGPRVYVDVDFKAGVIRDWQGGKNTHDGHLGTDYLLPIGTRILAAAPGQVVRSYYDDDDGNVVTIQHPDGKLTIYCHLNERLVVSQQEVKRGDPVGLSGHTGKMAGPNPHLHFQFGGYGRGRIDPYRDISDPSTLCYWTVDNNPQYPF